MIDRAKFFARVRASPFAGSLSQSQVDGMGAVMDAAPADLPITHLAYCLATTFHETARTMQPVKEYGGPAYYTKMYDPKGSRPHVAKALGNIFPGDGAKFAGRGYVQLTGRSNYARAAGITGADLVDNPDLAMKPDLAARIMFEGMSKGWFTGKKLADYFGAGKDDPVDARRIINGLDCAEAIAGHHRAFLKALRAAEIDALLAQQKALGNQAAVQENPRPAPAHMIEAPKPGFLSRLAGLFGKG